MTTGSFVVPECASVTERNGSAATWGGKKFKFHISFVRRTISFPFASILSKMLELRFPFIGVLKMF